MVHVQCTYIIQVHFDYCNIICLAMQPLQQNFTHYIKMTMEFEDKLQHLAPVVQKVDNAIQRINLYPLDSVIGSPNSYPLDSDVSGG